MGLLAYRDVGDEYVTRMFDLSPDIQDIYAHLLELHARGGGDWPESVNEALDVAVNKLQWTSGGDVRRIVFLVGDAPPHMDYAQDTKYPEVLRMARDRGITVNAVQAGSARDTERVWREIAQMGNGKYIPIPQDGGLVVIIETPFDLEIIELQRKLGGTVIPYGPRQQRSAVEAKTKQAAAAPAAVASEMATYMSKRAFATTSGGGYAEAVTGDGDLVTDVKSGRQALDKLKDEELPDSFRKLGAAERKAFIEEQAASRKVLTDRMAELVKKRDAHMAEQRKKAPAKPGDSFDRVVEETLKTQLKR